jgi:hypothetical protein
MLLLAQAVYAAVFLTRTGREVWASSPAQQEGASRWAGLDPHASRPLVVRNTAARTAWAKRSIDAFRKDVLGDVLKHNLDMKSGGFYASDRYLHTAVPFALN